MRSSLFDEREHHTKRGLTFLRFHLHLPSHPFDQSGRDMESSAPALSEEISILILFSNLSRIRDLSHRPRIPLIGSNGELPSLFGNGIGGIVEEIIQHPLNMKGEAPNP